MKFTIQIAVAALATVATARPNSMGKNDPLPQKSRITAFVINDKGEPSVECWELAGVTDSQQVQRADGFKATSHRLDIASDNDLSGVDILTWPSFAPIWPVPGDNEMHNENFDLSNTFNLFNIQGGLINFNFYAARFGMQSSDDDDEIEQHIFSMENGDDWFYFEDNYSGSAAAGKAGSEDTPFTFSTFSGSETELLRLKYKAQPSHKVVHKGACSFTGIEIKGAAQSAGRRTWRVHSPLTVQVKLEDL